MNAFLLDTHVLLWALMSPDRLTAVVAAMLSDPANTRFVSSVTALEIATLTRLGRLPDAGALVENYENHLVRFRATPLPIAANHALLAGSFPQPHRDPFDRLLAAQAILEGIPLISADRAISQFGATIIWR